MAKYLPRSKSIKSGQKLTHWIESVIIFHQLGTTLAPFVVDLGGEVHPGLPIAVFGGLMLAAAVPLLFAPETRGRPMVQNVRDLETREWVLHWIHTAQCYYYTHCMI